MKVEFDIAEFGVYELLGWEKIIRTGVAAYNINRRMLLGEHIERMSEISEKLFRCEYYINILKKYYRVVELGE